MGSANLFPNPSFSWIIGEDERVPDRLAIPFQKFRNRGCRDLNPASRRVRGAEVNFALPKQAACQPRWLAKLERKFNARDYYPAVSGVQEPELFDDQEQEDDHGPAGVLQVLQYVPQAYAAQRDEVIRAACSF